MVSMVPGANAALTLENPHLTTVVMGLGWSVVPSRGPQAEPVAAAILCGSDGRAISDEHLVFFNQIATPEASVEFGTGESGEYLGGEDQEQIDVDLPQVPDEVAKITFVVYIDPEVRGPGTFSTVRNAYIRVADPQNRELLRFEVPSGTATNINAMVFGELYRHSSGWKFRAVGQGYTTGLRGVAEDFRIAL
ncbi:calcium homeostasis/redox stress adaptation protein [Arthrobacter ginkgonis]|uniref:Calcium homeostasis/redox stress adaptation protein n=1 Tax=Arthrobacter ginkgonis TaxID=1630594 RepID=A0ABP7DB82_9MICC